jgi:hypothetical protein
MMEQERSPMVIEYDDEIPGIRQVESKIRETPCEKSDETIVPKTLKKE